MTEIVCGPWDNYFPPGPGPFLVGPRESQLYARPELPLTHGHTHWWRLTSVALSFNMLPAAVMTSLHMSQGRDF